MQHTIILPDLGQTTNEARIAAWLKRTGEHVKRGEPLVLVETDKVNVDVEAFEAGYLRETLVAEGELAGALMPIAILTDSPDESYSTAAAPAAPAQQSIEPIARATEPSTTGRRPAAPAARKRAAQLGIDLAGLAGTGSNGLITSADVERAAAEVQKQDSGASKMPPLRTLQAMANSVIESKREIPHFYATIDLALKHAAQWRTARNLAEPDEHITYNDVFVRCAALALADTPRMRKAFAGGRFEERGRADVVVIAELEGTLSYTPLPDADVMPWADLRRVIRRRGAAAISNPATPALAISNLGMYGVKQFSAIIPPACTSVLAIGAVRQEAVFEDGGIIPRLIASVTLSADHRVVDGVTAARYLERLQHHLNSL
jgi:pyruvate dehydrogenase E2 component (dihydrolipoamide acetyltransferase)